MKLMTLSTSLATLLAFAALAACGGTDGAPGTPGAPGEPGKPGEAPTNNDPASVSIVTPTKGVLDREIEVQIGGSKTKFAEGAKPDFGPGIEVLEVTAASPTLLIAKLRIAAGAKVGPRTVKIGDVEAVDAFTVLPGLKVASSKLQQGGTLELALENNDTTAFDASSFRLITENFLELDTAIASGQSGSTLLLAPPLATVGKGALTYANFGADGKPRTTFISADDAVEVTSRAASPIVFGTPKLGEAAGEKLAASLYKFATPGNENAAVEVTFHVEAAGAVLWTALWGAGGKAGDLVGTLNANQKEAPYDVTYLLPITSGASSDMFLTALDLSAKGGKFDLSALKVPATIIAEAAAPHSELEEAQAFTFAAPGAANFIKGEVTDDAFDWYKITVLPGQSVVLSVDSTAPMIAAVVNAQGQAIADVATSAAKEGVRTAPLTAGDYYILVGGETETDVGHYTATVKRIITGD